MAIFTMTTDASKASYTVSENTARSYGWNDTKPLMMEMSYEGCVLDTGEMNSYDDSDFYAVVWTGSKIIRVTYGSTRFWTYPNHAKVDATPEVIEAAREYAFRFFVNEITERSKLNARTVEAGKRVRVVKGRKLAKGIEGEVIRLIRNDYDKSNPQVSLDLGNGNIAYTYLNNLEVVNPESYEKNQDEINELARHYANQNNWRGITYSGYPVF